MKQSRLVVPEPVNEPILNYAPGDHERDRIQKVLSSMRKEVVEIPCLIGGKEVRTGKTKKVVMPHQHKTVIAEFHLAGPEQINQAAQSALNAKAQWESMQWSDRVAVFLKAADLLAGPYRDCINASTMLGQSKNIYQAEIDAACELIDFFKFNAFYYQQMLETQPLSSPGIWNQLEYRPLEGFVTAITPFNFTSIAANLAASPAMVGNTVVWKPSDTQMLSAYYTMKLFKEAGFPDGVINLIAADGPEFGESILRMNDLAGVHFTGSTQTFRKIYSTIGQNISNYRSYPRIVGETGGKDFIFAHASADVQALCTAIIRGAFEYQGQKCSAASRVYIPKSIWSELKERIVEQVKQIKMGDVEDFSCFMNAVIDEKSFDKISGYLEVVKQSSCAEFLTGGHANKDEGYFIEPTVVVTSDPKFKTMEEEIFGPVTTVFVYDDEKLEDTLKVCDQTSPYALTGAVFAQDRAAINKVAYALRNAAGNFYINDKPTGAVVGQQPFGGARASGTNDKAGSILNLYRWVSPRTIKEVFNPPKSYSYPFMG